MDIGEASSITIFVMTDAAINRLPGPCATAIKTGNDDRLERLVLSYLIVPEPVVLPRTGEERAYLSKSGQRVRLSQHDGAHWLNRNARIVETQRFSGGVVYIIADPVAPSPLDTLDYLRSTGKHKEFLRLVDLAGIDTLLDLSWSFTLFAPTDGAFEALPQSARASLFDSADGAMREAFLRSLIFDGRHYVDGLQPDGKPAPTTRTITSIGGAPRRLARLNASVSGLLDGARVGTCDIDTTTGLVHELTTVPTPLVPKP